VAWFREKAVGERSAFDGAGLATVRAVADPVPRDRHQQHRHQQHRQALRGVPSGTHAAVVEGLEGLQGAAEADLTRQQILMTGRLGHQPADQVVRQQDGPCGLTDRLFPLSSRVVDLLPPLLRRL